VGCWKEEVGSVLKCGVVLVFPLSGGNLKHSIQTDSTVVKLTVDCYFVTNVKSFRCV
jgi:hypothetical protein